MTHCQTPHMEVDNYLPMSPPPPPTSRSICVQASGYIDSPPVQDAYSSLPSLSLSPSEPEHGTQFQAPFTPRNLNSHLGYPQTNKLSTHEAETKNNIPSFLPIRLSVLNKRSNNRPSLLDFEEQAIDFLLQSRATKIALSPRPRVLITPEAAAEEETDQPTIEKDVSEFVPPLPLIDTPQIFQRTARSA